jgi:hypothetical protein
VLALEDSLRRAKTRRTLARCAPFWRTATTTGAGGKGDSIPDVLAGQQVILSIKLVQITGQAHLAFAPAPTPRKNLSLRPFAKNVNSLRDKQRNA